MEIFLSNDYPLKFIFDTINLRLKYTHTHTHIQLITRLPINRTVGYPFQVITIPFISALSHKFKHITKDLEASLSYFSINKLGNIIRPHKDLLPVQHHKNVI